MVRFVSVRRLFDKYNNVTHTVRSDPETNSFLLWYHRKKFDNVVLGNPEIQQIIFLILDAGANRKILNLEKLIKLTSFS